MVFAYDNNIDDYTLTADAYSSTYEVDNIKDKKLTKVWMGTTVDATQRIVIDAGAAVAPDLIAILGHNFTTETISIQANSSDSWVTPAVDYEFSSIKDIMFYNYTGSAYRYWSILIENCLPLNPPEIGYAFIGDIAVQPDPDTITPSGIDDNSTFEKSDNNELFGTKGEILRQSFQLNFTLLSEAEFTIFKTIFETVGKAIPFIIIWNLTTDYVAVPNIYCSFISGISIDSIVGFTIPGIAFTIEECK